VKLSVFASNEVVGTWTVCWYVWNPASIESALRLLHLVKGDQTMPGKYDSLVKVSRTIAVGVIWHGWFGSNCVVVL
jgi:hypothetical protein